MKGEYQHSPSHWQINPCDHAVNSPKTMSNKFVLNVMQWPSHQAVSYGKKLCLVMRDSVACVISWFRNKLFAYGEIRYARALHFDGLSRGQLLHRIVLIPIKHIVCEQWAPLLCKATWPPPPPHICSTRKVIESDASRCTEIHSFCHSCRFAMRWVSILWSQENVIFHRRKHTFPLLSHPI